MQIFRVINMSLFMKGKSFDIDDGNSSIVS